MAATGTLESRERELASQLEELEIDDTVSPWEGWTKQQKKIMMEHISYHIDKIEEINKCWQYGPIEKAEIAQKPNNELSFIYLSDADVADSLQAKSTKNNTNKPKVIDIDLKRYLESKLITSSEYSVEDSEMPTSSLDEIGTHLKKRVHSFKQKQKIKLAEHFVFGEELSRSKDLFISLKKKTNSKKSWNAWILDNVGISRSYVNKHITVYNLIKEFPKLLHLSISFKEMNKISSKIKTLFAEDRGVADAWK